MWLYLFRQGGQVATCGFGVSTYTFFEMVWLVGLLAPHRLPPCHGVRRRTCRVRVVMVGISDRAGVSVAWLVGRVALDARRRVGTGWVVSDTTGWGLWASGWVWVAGGYLLGCCCYDES